jgi:hypothetical protein
MVAYNDLAIAKHIGNKLILCSGEVLALADITFVIAILSTLLKSSVRTHLNDENAPINPIDAGNLRLKNKLLGWLDKPFGQRAHVMLQNLKKLYIKLTIVDLSSRVAWSYKECILQFIAPFINDLNRYNEFSKILAFGRHLPIVSRCPCAGSSHHLLMWIFKGGRQMKSEPAIIPVILDPICLPVVGQDDNFMLVDMDARSCDRAAGLDPRNASI